MNRTKRVLLLFATLLFLSAAFAGVRVDLEFANDIKRVWDYDIIWQSLDIIDNEPHDKPHVRQLNNEILFYDYATNALQKNWQVAMFTNLKNIIASEGYPCEQFCQWLGKRRYWNMGVIVSKRYLLEWSEAK